MIPCARNPGAIAHTSLLVYWNCKLQKPQLWGNWMSWLYIAGYEIATCHSIFLIFEKWGCCFAFILQVPVRAEKLTESSHNKQWWRTFLCYSLSLFAHYRVSTGSLVLFCASLTDVKMYPFTILLINLCISLSMWSFTYFCAIFVLII